MQSESWRLSLSGNGLGSGATDLRSLLTPPVTSRHKGNVRCLLGLSSGMVEGDSLPFLPFHLASLVSLKKGDLRKTWAAFPVAGPQSCQGAPVCVSSLPPLCWPLVPSPPSGSQPHFSVKIEPLWLGSSCLLAQHPAGRRATTLPIKHSKLAPWRHEGVSWGLLTNLLPVFWHLSYEVFSGLSICPAPLCHRIWEMILPARVPLCWYPWAGHMWGNRHWSLRSPFSDSSLIRFFIEWVSPGACIGISVDSAMFSWRITAL